MKFQKAQKKKSKLRLALTGPAGSGKTWGALQIAKGLGGTIAVIDTEHGSASLYEHLVDFDVLELQAPYSPERFIEAIDSAEQAGYETLIIDSSTHEWSGQGGCLEINEEIAKSKFRGNTWSAWNETSARHRKFVDRILQSKMHVITTIRSKTETAQQESITGKKQVVKLGMKAEQRDGLEYEFGLVLDIIHDGHYATASKDRTGLFVDKDPKPITPETGAILKNWLESGAEITPEPQTDYAAMIDEAQSIVELTSIWQMLSTEQKANLKPKFSERKEFLTSENEAV
jgi:nucleoside-triphosphatase THEP1